MTLACARLGHPTSHAKGADLLPTALTAPLETSLVDSLEPGHLATALDAVTVAATLELLASGVACADRLRGPLQDFARGGRQLGTSREVGG